MVDKEELKDTMGRPLTQSLFLELGYSDFSVFTLKDDDYEYNGKVYPSLKKLFLESMDITEYEFATKNLLGWKHWQRLCANKAILKHVEEWRDELEIKLASQGVKSIVEGAKFGNQTSAKWLAERGWMGKKVGRPSKVEKAAQKAFDDALESEFEETFRVIEGRFS